MSTTNQIKKDAEVAEKRGRRVESNDLESKVLKKTSSKSRKEFERRKTKNKKKHDKDPNGEVKFETMKKTKKTVGEQLKKKRTREMRA